MGQQLHTYSSQVHDKYITKQLAKGTTSCGCATITLLVGTLLGVVGYTLYLVLC